MLVFPVRLGRNCLEEMRDVSNLNVLRIFLGCFRDVFGFGQLPGFVPGDFFLSVSWYRSPIKPPFGRRFFVFFPGILSKSKNMRDTLGICLPWMLGNHGNLTHILEWIVQPATSWLCCANRDWATGWLDDHFSYFSCSLQIEKCLGMRKFQNFWGNMFYLFSSTEEADPSHEKSALLGI